MIKILLGESKIDGLKKAINFDIIINQNKLAKKVSLKIDNKKRLPVLTLPKHFSKPHVLSFLDKHQCWIENKLSQLPQEKFFSFNQKIEVLGKSYIIKQNKDLISNCKIIDDVIYAPIDADFLHARVIKCIKSIAKKELLSLAQQKADLVGGNLKSITIKDTKSRWGSCSSTGNINFNFRLVLAPLYVCEAIVCHEVCHLIEHNHGPNFYNLLYSICPDYDKAENWLKLKSKELYAYS